MTIFVGLTLSFSPKSNGQCLFLDFKNAFLVWKNDIKMAVYLDFGVLLWWWMQTITTAMLLPIIS